MLLEGACHTVSMLNFVAIYLSFLPSWDPNLQKGLPLQKSFEKVDVQNTTECPSQSKKKPAKFKHDPMCSVLHTTMYQTIIFLF